MEQQVSIHPWRHNKLQKQKDSSPRNGSITLTKCRIQNFPRKAPSTVNFVAVILLKQNTTTLIINWKLEWPQSKPLSNWKYRSHYLQDLRTIKICNNYGSGNKWDRSKTFRAGITIKMLFPFWKQCRKWLLFTTTKLSIGWNLVVLYQTRTIFAKTNLQMQNCTTLRRQIKTWWRNFEKMLLLALVSLLHAT